MNAFEPNVPESRKARIEIIPLIDVVFFLLATFVLFTLSLQKIKTIDLELPVTPPIPTTEEDSTVYLQASAEGTVYWKLGGRGPAELITAAEVRPKLDHYKGSVPVPRVFIRSDGAAKFGAGVFLLDEVRRAGIRQVSVETKISAPGS